MCGLWSNALRCWPSLLLMALLAGCVHESGRRSDLASPIRTQTPACQQYSQAWVAHFRANVAVQDGRRGKAAEQELALARELLRARETDEACYKPYCLIQPKAEGRLDTYCGYKIPEPSGEELYRWIPWTDLE